MMPVACAAWSPSFRYALHLWQGASEETTVDSLDPGQIDACAFERTLAQHRLALALPAADTLGPSVPAPLRAALRRRQRRMTARALQQAAATREIVAALRAAGIRYCVLKGQGYAALFDMPHRREACDIDLLIADHVSRQALLLLHALGYVLDEVAANDIERYRIDNHALPLRHAGTGLVLELHLRLANHERQFPLSEAIWDEHVTTVMLACTEVTTLAPSAAVVYAAFHGTKHNWHRAFWLVDMAQAMRSATLDWGATLALAKQLGVERQLAMSALLAEEVLGVALPAVLREQQGLLRVARPAAEALLPCLDVLGSDRGADLAARLGVARYALRLLSLQSTWRGRFHLVPFLLAPTESDRRAFPLPAYLHWAYPGVRAIRLLQQHVIKRRRTRG